VRLVRRLETETARFFIHVDARAPSQVIEVTERELGLAPNVRLLPRRRVQWAAFSQVEAVLDGVKALLDWPEELAYGVLLTGQDYPLRPPEVIERELEQADGRSFMTYRPSTGRFLKRLTRRHWHRTVLGRKLRLPNRLVPIMVRRSLPEGLRPYHGSGHWCLSRKCLDYVASRDPEEIELFRWASSPDEALFQTILINSPLSPTIVNDDLRYVDWSEGGASPRVLTTYDLDRMLASHCLFARKFDPRVDAEVIDALDASIDARTRPARSGA
jgi:core-2/I-Branching enzyme